MFKRYTSIALACALSSFVPPAAAQQQQTAEGAQRFLALLAKDETLAVRLSEQSLGAMSVRGTRQVSYRWLKDGVPAGQGPYADTSEALQMPLKWMLTITEITGTDERGNADPCTSKVDISTKEKLNSETHDDLWYTKEGFFIDDQLPYRRTFTSTFEDPTVKFAGPHYFPWGKAVISRTATGRISARVQGGKFDFNIEYVGEQRKDAEMADRVEYAMKFLKASCDKTAATGF